MAAAQVFAIPELLENILVFVEPLQLFTLQSVNSTFHSVITDTKALRRIMHLEQNDDFDSLKNLMSPARLDKIMSPFTLTLLPESRFAVNYRFNLPFFWLNQHKDNVGLALAEALAPCLQLGSWRNIKVISTTRTVIELFCDFTWIHTDRPIKCEDDSFGSIMAGIVQESHEIEQLLKYGYCDEATNMFVWDMSPE